MNRVYRFQLSLTLEECYQYYQGQYKSIQVLAHTGQTVQFPAEHIRAFVTPSGVQGVFDLEIDSNNKFKQLRKIN